MRGQFVLVVALLAAGIPARGQTPEATSPRPVQAFEDTIDVRVVNVEAVVTDRQGRRVTGLRQEDFKLFVDGVETPITFFSEIDEKKQRLSGEIAAGAGASGPAAEPVWQSRNILVFLDEATVVKARRDLVLRFLARQLDRLGPGDRMAVVAFAGSRLEVLCEWTGDRARLASVLAAVKKRPAHGIRQVVARREQVSDSRFTGGLVEGLGLDELDRYLDPSSQITEPTPPDPIGRRGIEREARTNMVQQRPSPSLPTQLFTPLEQYSGVAQAAAGAMRGLPAPPGRKMMLLFSEAFHRPLFARAVVREANRLGYSLYPVDVMGVDTFMAQNDVESMGPQPFFISTGLDSDMDLTMELMAAATGGKASLNSNRLLALERLVEDSTSYYLLGFSPTWRGDDRRHGIQLTVVRPGLAVRARHSYEDASRLTRLNLEADATLLLGRSSSEARLIVTAGEPAPADERGLIPISLGVPVESLAFVPKATGYRAEAPIAAVVLDSRGKRSELAERWLVVEVEQLPLEGTYARFNFSIAVEKRAQRIVITVHDARSGEALWGTARLQPPAR